MFRGERGGSEGEGGDRQVWMGMAKQSRMGSGWNRGQRGVEGSEHAGGKQE